MRTPILLLPAIVALLASCSTLQPTAEMRDGVYDLPKPAEVKTVATAEQPPVSNDDYYDSTAAQEFQQNYYDVAYNDPYYYNYDRFGFGVGLNYANYGGGYPGYGYGMNYSWGDPGYGWGSPWGYGSPYGSPWGYGWNAPYGYYDPWYGGMYPGYGYYGAGGCCYSCYSPWVVYGTPLAVAHRPTLGGAGSPGGTGGEGSQNRQAIYPSRDRNLVDLRPSMYDTDRMNGGRSTGLPASDPARNIGRPSTGTNPQRNGDRATNSWDRGSGGRSGGGGTPSFGGGGGGSSPVISPRPR
jgi:hypothetical protein